MLTRRKILLLPFVSLFKKEQKEKPKFVYGSEPDRYVYYNGICCIERRGWVQSNTMTNVWPLVKYNKYIGYKNIGSSVWYDNNKHMNWIVRYTQTMPKFELDMFAPYLGTKDIFSKEPVKFEVREENGRIIIEV